MDGHSLAVKVQEPSQVGEARRAIVHSATTAGYSQESVGKLGLIATELATNLLKHAVDGEIVFQLFTKEHDGFEVIALDKGPGMSDWRRAFTDGFSTSGTSGTGLGAVARSASEYFAYGSSGRGTIIVARLRKTPSHANQSDFEVGAVSLPIRGEEECGDAWALLNTRKGVRAVIADGLGHGPLASQASQAALAVARKFSAASPTELLERMHEVLRSTRGAAVAIADLDRTSGTMHFAGIGNVSAMIVTGEQIRQMVSHNGTAGLQVRRVQEFTYPWASTSILLMHSDGLGTHWSLDAYPGITNQHPSILGAALYRDFTRGRDDVTVLTVREKNTLR